MDSRGAALVRVPGGPTSLHHVMGGRRRHFRPPPFDVAGRDNDAGDRDARLQPFSATVWPVVSGALLTSINNRDESRRRPRSGMVAAADPLALPVICAGTRKRPEPWISPGVPAFFALLWSGKWWRLGHSNNWLRAAICAGFSFSESRVTAKATVRCAVLRGIR